MVKSTHTAEPNIIDVLEVLGLVPPSRLGLLLRADKHHHRNQLKGDGPLIAAFGRKRSLEEAATILGLSLIHI